jgi:hypothetical protein
MNKVDNPYAFPVSSIEHMLEGGEISCVTNGMTLRDYFASAALIGISSRGAGVSLESVANISYAYADAMLKERSKPKDDIS